MPGLIELTNNPSQLEGIKTVLGVTAEAAARVAADNAIAADIDELVDAAAEVVSLSRIPLTDPVAHAADQIDRRIKGLAVSASTQNLFSTATHTGTPAYVRNTSCWAAGINLTGVGVWNSTSGVTLGFTAITPGHVAFCDHALLANGTVLRWVTADNQIVERTLVSSQRILSTDIRVGVLSSDLPGTIQPVPILHVPAPSGLPVLTTDQEKKAIIFDLLNDTTLFLPSDSARALWNESAVTGDSGNGWYVVLDGKPALVSHFHFTSSGPAYHSVLATIQAATTGHTLPRADWRQTAWSAVSGKPAFSNAATIPASATAGIGEIPLVSSSGKIASALIPPGANDLVSSTGGNGAADAGKSAEYGLQGQLQAGTSPTGSQTFARIGPGEGGSSPAYFQGLGASEFWTSNGTNAAITIGRLDEGATFHITGNGAFLWDGNEADAGRMASRADLFAGTPTYADDAAAAADAFLPSKSPYLISGSTLLHLKP